MNISPFTLYGLKGCVHCHKAEAFMRARSLPTILVMANDDPVAKEGAIAVSRELMRVESKAAGKSEEETATAVAAVVEEYPILVSRVTREVIKGFKEADYERLANVVFSLNSASASSVFAQEQ
jgi:hypothetical protein